jgi:hypothetical protein
MIEIWWQNENPHSVQKSNLNQTVHLTNKGSLVHL